MLPVFISPLSLLLSVTTVTGVLLHDMRIDKATTLSLPAAIVNYDNTIKLTSFSDLHPHTERSVFAQAVNDLSGHDPRIQPRASEDKKHLLQKHAGRGHHAFDNYNLPIV